MEIKDKKKGKMENINLLAKAEEFYGKTVPKKNVLQEEKVAAESPIGAASSQPGPPKMSRPNQPPAPIGQAGSGGGGH